MDQVPDARRPFLGEREKNNRKKLSQNTRTSLLEGRSSTAQWTVVEARQGSLPKVGK